MKFDSQQYDVDIKHDAAEAMGINTEDVDDTISTLLGGTNITDFMMGGQSYHVIVQAKKNKLHDPAIINQIYIKTAFGEMTPIKNVVSFKPVLRQQQLNRYEQLRSAMISAQVAPGHQLSDVVRRLQAGLPHLLPADAKYAFAGKAKRTLEAGKSMSLIFLL